jgi:isopenicillin N synthase-like dioxygenase
MQIYIPAKPATHIPVIDISTMRGDDFSARKKTAWEVHKACRETGFFYISGHGVSASLIDAQFEQARQLFALPHEQKLALHQRHSPTGQGFNGIGDQRLDSQDPHAEIAPVDLKEGFHCGLEVPDDDPWAKAGWRGYGHNQWPASLPAFRTQTLTYIDAMREVADCVVSLLALSLDLPADWFAELYEPPNLMVRMLGYPPHLPGTPVNQLGAGAHTDWGAVTLLAQDDVGGLEVRTVEGEWIAARPIPGTFVVNLGDLMPRWTNDLYRSNMHRVKNVQIGRWRYSIPFFYNPRPTARIACLPGCADADNPPRYEPCTSGEHIAEMARRAVNYS